MQVFTNIASQFVPFYGDMTPATKAERARAHAEKQRVVEASQAAISKLRGVAPQRAVVTPIASAPRASRADEQVRLRQELRQALATNVAYRQQARDAKQVERVVFSNNPAKARAERENENNRLLALKREIQHEQRSSSWLSPRN